MPQAIPAFIKLTAAEGGPCYVRSGYIVAITSFKRSVYGSDDDITCTHIIIGTVNGEDTGVLVTETPDQVYAATGLE